jgi:hypothetical protein
MELKINELDDELDNDVFYDDNFESYDNEPIHSSFEKIPENTIPIKVIKNVRFDETSVKPMHQSIPKSNAKISRQQIPPKKPQISYEDILSKMGMLVSNGKLHLVDRNTIPSHLQKQVTRKMGNNQSQQYEDQQIPQQVPQQIPQNSYIFNKYFKEELNQPEEVRRPRTLQEYKMMLLQDHLQRQRIKQIKSTKLVMPTSNINMAYSNSGNLNKLFSFSKR